MSFGNNELHQAIESNDLGRIDDLLSGDNRQILVDEANDRGETPLHLSIRYFCYSAFMLLVGASKDLNAVDWHGNTPLHEAVRLNRYEMAGLLLREGASVDIANANQLTPLMCAAEQGNFPMIFKLLEYEASLTAIGPYGLSASRMISRCVTKHLSRLTVEN